MQGGGTTTQQKTPYAPAVPDLTQAASAAQTNYNNQSQLGTIPFPTLATPSANTTGSLDTLGQIGANGLPVANAANASLTNILSNPQQLAGNSTLSSIANNGGANPELSWMLAALNPQITDATNAQFGLGGRTGSVANQQALERNIGAADSNLIGSQFNAAQGNQIAAALGLNSGQNTQTGQQIAGAAAAPGVAGSSLIAPTTQLTAGQAQDQLSQAAINNQLANWLYPQQQSTSILNNYLNQANTVGNAGGTTSVTQPSQSIIPSILGLGTNALGFGTSGGGSILSSLLGL